MKTTIDIPEQLLQEAMANLNAATKREAVVTALEEFNRRRRAEKVIAMFGTFKNMMTQKELRKMREAREERHNARWHGSR